MVTLMALPVSSEQRCRALRELCIRPRRTLSTSVGARLIDRPSRFFQTQMLSDLQTTALRGNWCSTTTCLLRSVYHLSTSSRLASTEQKPYALLVHSTISTPAFKPSEMVGFTSCLPFDAIPSGKCEPPVARTPFLQYTVSYICSLLTHAD